MTMNLKRKVKERKIRHLSLIDGKFQQKIRKLNQAIKNTSCPNVIYSKNVYIKAVWGFPWGLDDKESACNAGETHVQSLGWEDLLEKEMVTHSSILPWKIPWTEKPGRLQAMGSQRVRRD